MSNQRRASVAFVLATLGLDAIGVGIIAPIVPELVRQLGGLPPERAAPWVGALIASYAFVQFFAAPLLGELSDRFGRRPVILIGSYRVFCWCRPYWRQQGEPLWKQQPLMLGSV
jgi:DHA1 family tetracycline resistance protein-like MFS transporter